jgi:hypothetical protein
MCAVSMEECPGTSHMSGPETNRIARWDSNRRHVGTPALRLRDLTRAHPAAPIHLTFLVLSKYASAPVFRTDGTATLLQAARSRPCVVADGMVDQVSPWMSRRSQAFLPHVCRHMRVATLLSYRFPCSCTGVLRVSRALPYAWLSACNAQSQPASGPAQLQMSRNQCPLNGSLTYLSLLEWGA